jgi:hypothetical protein
VQRLPQAEVQPKRFTRKVRARVAVTIHLLLRYHHHHHHCLRC